MRGTGTLHHVTSHPLPPKPDGDPAGMTDLAEQLLAAADRIKADAAATRGHLMGFRGPAADRVRDYLQDNQNQAHNEASELTHLAALVLARQDDVSAALRKWNRDRDALAH